MKTIDFLPDIYRQREALRRARLWWGIVIVVFSTAIGASSIAQAWLRHGTQRHLDSLAADYAAAQAQVHELSSLQSQIVRAGQEASLYTFLQNPWPRTQLLAQIVGPLPDCIRLTQIHIAEEETARTAIQAGPRSAKSDEDASAKASAAEKDLARLQEENGRRHTAIEVDGHSTDVPRLHEYVAAISRSPIIAGATIKSLEAAANQVGKTRFTLKLQIRAGYCQTNGEVVNAAPAGSGTSPPPAIGGGG